MLASNGGDSESGDSVGTIAGRIARKVLLPWGTLALAALVLALGVHSISRKTACRLPAYALRTVTVTIATSLLALAGLNVQACSSGNGSHPLSFRDQAVEITTVPDGAEFYLADGQQSPMAVTNTAAAIISRTVLHPFGHVRFQTGKSGDPWGFVGNEEDRGSGISDFHARPYRPELGVFLAVDPVALLSPEKLLEKPRAFAAYLYAISDPLNNVDPDGLEPQKKGFWTQLGQNAVHMAAEAVCMSLGGCGYANAPGPGDRTYRQASTAEIALNLTAAHVAPRIASAIASRILKGGTRATVSTEVGVADASQAVKRLALGRNRIDGQPTLQQFADRIGGRRVIDIDHPKGLDLRKEILAKMHGADEIHFNLEGMGDLKAAYNNGRTLSRGATGYTTTNWEFVQVVNNFVGNKPTFFHTSSGEVIKGADILPKLR